LELIEIITEQAKQLAELTRQNSELTSMIGKFFASKNTDKGETKEMHIPKGCSLFQRKSDCRWEARIMIDGKQQFVACTKNKSDAYDKLIKANRIKKKSVVKKDKEFTLFSWLDHWHAIYRMPMKGTELSANTIIMDLSMIRKIKKIFKDAKLRDITADVIQQKLYSMTQGRTCEGVYTTLKLALEKAKDRLGRNVMEQVEKVKHARKTGRALLKEEVDLILKSTINQTEHDIWLFYFNTGCRTGEIETVKVGHIDLERNEVFIDGSKTKGSKRIMPIMPILRPVLERLIKDRDQDEKLFKLTINQIRTFYKRIKAETKISFTMKDTRHTFATACKDAGIPVEVYHKWFGWSDDSMARRVYTHRTEKDKEVAQVWAKKFEEF